MNAVKKESFLFLLLFIQVSRATEQGSINQYQDNGIQMNETSRMRRSRAVDVSAVSGQTKYCRTEICKKVTADMLLSLDHNEEPCEDFHKFACGDRNEAKNDFINEQYGYIEQYLHNQLSESYIQLYYDFKESCVNYQTDFDVIAKIKFAREYIGTNLTGVFIDLILTQSLPLFDIGVGIGKYSNYEFQITIPGKSTLKTTTANWSIFEYIKKDCRRRLRFKKTPEASYDLNQMYAGLKECEINVLEKKIHQFFNVSKLAAVEFTGDMKVDDLVEFLAKLQKITPSENEQRKDLLQNSYKEISLEALRKKYDLLDWKTLFEGIAKDTVIQDDQVIQLYFSDYMDKMFQLIGSYGTGRLVKILRQFYSLQFYHNLVAPRNENRFTYCMELTCELLPDMTNLIMYEIHRTDSEKFTFWNFLTMQLFENLKKELSSAIESSAIEDTAKKIFKDKLATIQLGMITSGNTNFSASDYAELTIKKDTFQENLLILLKMFRKKLYSLVNANVDPASLLNYFISPFYDQPVSFYQSKYIVFHPAIYYKIPMNLPENLKIAKVGLHFGRELAKHFDLTGRQYLIKGDVKSSDSFYDFLKTRTNELMNSIYLKNPYQLHKYEVTFQDVDGELLVNELIADNTAFRIIWDIYQKKEKENLPWVYDTFSLEQIFFIFSAQEYCEQTNKEDFMIDLFESRRVPSEIKIHNIISNSGDFAETFGCPDGSAMLLVDPNLITQFPHIQIDEDYAVDNEYD